MIVPNPFPLEPLLPTDQVTWKLNNIPLSEDNPNFSFRQTANKSFTIMAKSYDGLLTTNQITFEASGENQRFIASTTHLKVEFPQPTLSEPLKSEHHFLVGDGARLSLVANNVPEDAQVVWCHNGKKFEQNLSTPNMQIERMDCIFKLSIRALVEDNAGEYTCTIRCPAISGAKVLNSKTTMSVTRPILKELPLPKIYQTHSIEVLQESSDEEMEIHQMDVKINEIQQEDMDLTIEKPDTIEWELINLTPDEPVECEEGEKNVILEASFNRDPKHNVKWTRNGQIISQYDNDFQIQKDGCNQKLIIREMRKSKTDGEYYCGIPKTTASGIFQLSVVKPAVKQFMVEENIDGLGMQSRIPMTVAEVPIEDQALFTSRLQPVTEASLGEELVLQCEVGASTIKVLKERLGDIKFEIIT